MPHEGQTFTNARTGQTMTFVELRAEILRIDTVNPPSGEIREPLHIHPLQESGAEVQSGELVFEVDGVTRRVGPGETIVIPAGVPHCFWNEGDDDARATQTFRPALELAAFFETYAALAADGDLDRRGMPKPLQLAAMIPVFSDAIRPVKPPWIVQRIFAALIGPIARVAGVHGRVALPVSESGAVAE